MTKPPSPGRPRSGTSTLPRVVTREMVHVRTRELALRAGRIPPQVAQIDYEQAKRELTGESESDRQDAVLNATPPVVSSARDPHPRQDAPCRSS